VSSSDKTLKVFDLLSGSLIDWILFENSIKSFDLSPNGQHLATSHVGQKGIFVWTLKSFYEQVQFEKVPNAP
jgi:WD40 repeat protein